jgi:hypothetical protein
MRRKVPIFKILTVVSLAIWSFRIAFVILFMIPLLIMVWSGNFIYFMPFIFIIFVLTLFYFTMASFIVVLWFLVARPIMKFVSSHVNRWAFTVRFIVFTFPIWLKKTLFLLFYAFRSLNFFLFTVIGFRITGV